MSKVRAASQRKASYPYLIWALIFIIVPLLMVIYYTFTDAAGSFTMDNILSIGDYMDTFLLSIWLGAIATFLCLLIAYPAAYIMSRMKASRQKTMLMLVMLPMWINLLLRTYALMGILEDTGLINRLLTLLHLPNVHMINTPGAVVLGMIYNFLPYMILPLYSIMTKVDGSIIEAAQDLGSQRIRYFPPRHSAIERTGDCFGGHHGFCAVDQHLLYLAKAGRHQHPDRRCDRHEIFLRKQLQPWRRIILCAHADDLDLYGCDERVFGRRRGGDSGMTKLSKVYMALLLLLMYAPIAVMIFFSFNSSDSTSVFTGFSLKWYSELFRDKETIQALINTLILAVISAVVSTVLGTAAAVGINAMGKGMRKTVNMVTNIPMMNPEIVTGVSMMLLFVFAGRLLGIVNVLGFWTLLIAHITFNLPYVILSVLPSLRRTDRHLSEAAQDLGCTPFSAFFRVVLPSIMPGIISGMLMAFTLSIDDFVISYFTSGPSFQTLPLRIYSMTKRRVKPDINALSTLMFAAILILLILMNVREAREDKKQRSVRGGK